MMAPSRSTSEPRPATSEPPPFPAISENVLQAIQRISRSEHYARNEEIVIQGLGVRCVYYVRQGAVEVSHTVRETRLVVALIGAGQVFGEIGFFDGISRVRNVRAVEDTTLQVIDAVALQALLTENPPLYGALVGFLAQSICAKFRSLLEEREPLTAYAASLSTGRRSYEESKPLPAAFFHTPAWNAINRIVEQTKSRFFDLSHQLQEIGNGSQAEALQPQCNAIVERFSAELQEFARGNDARAEGAEHAWGYVFKEIFPYFMRSRFAERAYYKPRGYAGDHMMMEMIYRNQPEGDGKLGALMDSWCLNSDAAAAVRGRRALLGGQLEAICAAKLAQAAQPVRIMNLACGSNRELFDFLSRCKRTQAIEATCIDADADALAYTNQYVNTFNHQASIRLMHDNVVKWALRAVRHEYAPQDIIYSAGLTDYLDDRLFKALIARAYDYLKPGGVLIIGNFSPKNRHRAIMDYILQWKLIYRDIDELAALYSDGPFGKQVQIIAEEQGVNLFAVATKAA